MSSAMNPFIAKRSSAQIMQQVMLALMPALFTLTVLFGIGSLLNVFWTLCAALLAEALALHLRKVSILAHLKDGSAIVTALLLALALPPATPWWICISAAFFAILISKQAYGGLGQNLFNPAMAGYAMVLVSVPSYLLYFPTDANTVSEAVQLSLGLASWPDHYTSATVLSVVQQNQSLMLDQLWQSELFGKIAGAHYEWVAAAFLLGGIYLIVQGIISWHIPVAFFVGLSVPAFFFYDGGSSVSSGSALFHCVAGGSMMAAFFILTDPVTNCADRHAKLAFAAFSGVVVFFIREYSSYPDGIAFAVLLVNTAAPLIDKIALTIKAHKA